MQVGIVTAGKPPERKKCTRVHPDGDDNGTILHFISTQLVIRLEAFTEQFITVRFFFLVGGSLIPLIFPVITFVVSGYWLLVLCTVIAHYLLDCIWMFLCICPLNCRFIAFIKIKLMCILAIKHITNGMKFYSGWMERSIENEVHFW